MACEGTRTFGEHLGEAFVDHLIERAGPAGAFVLRAFLAAAKRAVGRATRGVGLGFTIEARFAVGFGSERRERELST